MLVDTANLSAILQELGEHHATLVAVSKKKSAELIRDVYNSGHRIFGENYVKELADKYLALPKDIEWHFIGHLQSNKVKTIASFVSLIQSVDSVKLLEEINKEGKKHDRIIPCLLQIHIAAEETKFGFSMKEAENIFVTHERTEFPNVLIKGLMGMATYTDDAKKVRDEFKLLNKFFNRMKSVYTHSQFTILSMGMTSDYKIALEEGSNMVRIGSAIFGERI
jgi:pyridoxal phosphate enzyme (YggS family)